MKSQFVNGTINKDIYIHPDAETLKRLSQAEEDIQNLEETKQDKLIAGENITISEDNIISATGGIDPEQLVTVITAEATDEQVPSAKAVWNQAAKYTKVKRFIGHIQDNEEGKPLILDSNNLADIYNAQTFGNQIVFIFDDTNKLTYRVNYCFIDNTYPEAQKIVVYATAEHADTEQEPTFGVSERYFDTLYAKAAAGAQQLYPYTRQLQDKSFIVDYSIISGEGTSENPFVLSHNADFITILNAFNNGKQVIAKLDASPVTGVQGSYLIANLSQITPTSFDFVGMGYIGRFVSFIIDQDIADRAIGIIQ